MDQGRVGDALKVNYVETDGKAHLRVTFEYCEGEHYYKYSGWKRIWTIHTLYDEPLDKTNVDDLHRLFADLVRVWYESHLPEPRRLDQIPQANVREGRDVQSVNPRLAKSRVLNGARR